MLKKKEHEEIHNWLTSVDNWSTHWKHHNRDGIDMFYVHSAVAAAAPPPSLALYMRLKLCADADRLWCYSSIRAMKNAQIYGPWQVHQWIQFRSRRQVANDMWIVLTAKSLSSSRLDTVRHFYKLLGYKIFGHKIYFIYFYVRNSSYLYFAYIRFTNSNLNRFIDLNFD